jgi:hypothetical protein
LNRPWKAEITLISRKSGAGPDPADFIELGETQKAIEHRESSATEEPTKEKNSPWLLGHDEFDSVRCSMRIEVR